MRPMIVRALVAAVVVMVVMACGSPSPSSPAAVPAPPAAVALPPPPAHAYPGDPWTFQGERVPTGVLALTLGPDVCGFADLLILSMAKALGQRALSSDDALQYIRDPANAFDTVGHFEPSVAKPPDAYDTGYSYGSMELWRSASVGNDAVFMLRDGIWERWPRARETFACAAIRRTTIAA